MGKGKERKQAETEGLQAPDELDPLGEGFYRARMEELRARIPKKSRFKHCLGVSETAVSLARRYGVDDRKARLAGLLHDWDKGYDDAGIRQRVEELSLDVDAFLLERMPQLLHGPTAAAALARRFPCIPADVISAIEKHTAGAVGMGELDMVVYVADVIEPGRDFPGVDELRALPATESLEDLFVDVSAHVFANLIERHRFVHPQTLEVWNYYIARQQSRNKKGTK